MLEAAARWSEQQMRWHGRLIRVVWPFGDRPTSVGEAAERAAQGVGVERNGRSFEEFAGQVVAVAKAREAAVEG